MHYHLMNGTAGCIPDSNDTCELWAHAFDTAKQRFGDTLCDDCYRAMLESLASSSTFIFNDDCENMAPDDVQCRAGADYVEISPCWDDECVDEWGEPAPDASVSTIAICADCAMMLANGDDRLYCRECGGTEGDPRGSTCPHCGSADTFLHSSRMADADVTLGATDCAYCADGEETLPPCEPWFSWRPCDLCDSPDGGDRVDATAS